MTHPDVAPVRRAIIPAAGRGTRMRTLAGTASKELLPVGDAPLLFHALADCVRGGIRELIIVTAPDKPDIARAVSTAQPQDTPHVAAWRTHFATCTVHFVEQPDPMGLAHAIRCAASLLGAEPFVLFLPDNVFVGEGSVTAQLLDTFATVQHTTMGMVPVQPEATEGLGNSGAIAFDAVDTHSVRITHLGDKGSGGFTDATGSGWRTCGASVLTPEFLEINAGLAANAKGEWDDVPILQQLARTGRLFGRRLAHRCYDAGNPTGYTAATAAGPTLPPLPERCHV